MSARLTPIITITIHRPTPRATRLRTRRSSTSTCSRRPRRPPVHPQHLTRITEAYQREPRMPVINGEVCYEGIGEACRQEVSASCSGPAC